MRQVPYYGNRGNACALACYLMAAQYLFPDKGFTFEQFAKIAEWKQGYVVWGFNLWKWLMDQGMKAVDYDTIDYEGWAKNGVRGLKESVPETQFKYFEETSFDLEAESRKVGLMFNHPNFTYIRRKPTWDDVIAEFNKSGICDLALNSRRLNKTEGYSSHRVILIDINDKEVVFHDPNNDWSGAYRKEKLGFFKEVFADMGAPELNRYYL